MHHVLTWPESAAGRVLDGEQNDHYQMLRLLRIEFPDGFAVEPVFDDVSADDLDVTVNIADGTIHFELLSRVSQDFWDYMRSWRHCQWWRKSKKFVKVYSPALEKLAWDLGCDVTYVTDERDPTARIDRYTTYADNADKRMRQAWQRSHDAVGQIPMGQPVLVGHHSERHHRAALRRSDNAMRQSVEEGAKADYWRDRAAGALSRYQHRQSSPVIVRRIRDLEKALKKVAGKPQEAGYRPDAMLVCGLTVAESDMLTIHFLEQRIEFEQALLQEVGGNAGQELADENKIQPGYIVEGRNGIGRVLRVNDKTVTTIPLYPNKYHFSKEKIENITKVKPSKFETFDIAVGDWVFLRDAWREVTKVTAKQVSTITRYVGWDPKVINCSRNEVVAHMTAAEHAAKLAAKELP